MSYDQATRTYSFYSEDDGLVGDHPFTLAAHLTDYPVTAAPAKAATITVVDPCLDPDILKVTGQPAIPDYLYTASPIIDFVLNPFEVFPPSCPVAYSCASGVTGPANFACDWTQFANFGAFDPATGSYQMMQTDMAHYPAGTYTMEITGTVGIKSVSVPVTFNLVDPCPTAQITLALPSQIVDATYVLRDSGQI